MFLERIQGVRQGTTGIGVAEQGKTTQGGGEQGEPLHIQLG